MTGKALGLGRSGVRGRDGVRGQGRRGRVLAVPVGAAAVWSAAALVAACAAGGGAVPAVSGAVPAAGSWGRAIEVPGLEGRSPELSGVSCGAAGYCVVGGDYTDRRGIGQGFVAAERHGRWGRAIGVPGLEALDKGRDVRVSAVSCGAAGNCVAGGDYAGRHGHRQGFVAVERDGRWAKAIGMPGLVAVISVSCPSAGNCAVAGPLSVVSLRHGRWGKAIAVPGLLALNKGSVAVTAVSCGAAGDCVVGGDYTDGRGIGQGFVAVERHGRWGRAIEVPGLGALNKGGDVANGMSAEVWSVSCPSAGNCAAGGGYWDRRGDSDGFVASLRNGRWGKAIKVPGLASWVFSVSCGSAGNCAAGGIYGARGFVASERDGRWGRAIQVPGLGALNKGNYAAVLSVSCGSAGNCAAGGYYTDRRHQGQGFLAVEQQGVWGAAIEVPGLGALNAGGSAGVESVSCPPAGTCAASGRYWDRRHHDRAFVVSQT